LSARLRVVIIGASGMLGHMLFRVLTERSDLHVIGTVRRRESVPLADHDNAEIWPNVDVENADTLAGVLDKACPEVVINCTGVVKQLGGSKDPLVALPLNAILPHRLARLSALCGARLIHISTDCVFDGQKGDYVESDVPTPVDLYGHSKFLGELSEPEGLTLRTSIIGHELNSRHGLVEWFIAQTGPVRGFTRAIFSGLPTDELSRTIRDYVLPNPELRGLYHVSAAPIAKYDLLRLIAAAYGRAIDVIPADEPVIDRSLNSARFRAITGYMPRPWPDLIRTMREYRL
jgi:dTDP-4-dehydrorhamnose reductase